MPISDQRDDPVRPRTEREGGIHMRIGIADGLYKIPEEFDEWDKEIERLFDAMAEEDWRT